MDPKLKQLEINMILKELEFVESDHEYKNEIIIELDRTFVKCVNEYLDEHPDVKEKFENHINSKIEESIKQKQEEIEEQENEPLSEEEVVDEIDNDIEFEFDPKDLKSPKIKKLYREIVKLTHPDKISNKKLNELYIQATNYYELNDLIAIYSVCIQLNIPYEMDDNDYILIKDKIRKMKERVFFIESTYTWKWHNTPEEEKNSLIETYVLMQLQSFS